MPCVRAAKQEFKRFTTPLTFHLGILKMILKMKNYFLCAFIWTETVWGSVNGPTKWEGDDWFPGIQVQEDSEMFP